MRNSILIISFLIFINFVLKIESAAGFAPWTEAKNNPCASQVGGWKMVYWPADGKCYEILTKGYPCPVTMELTAHTENGTLVAKCKCSPGFEQSNIDKQCHKVFETGPCELGAYFERIVLNEGITECHKPLTCSKSNEIFWPRTNKCYAEFSQGPCYRGQLLVRRVQNSPLGSCQCNSNEIRFQNHYSNLTRECHEHFTKGPCKDSGLLFLPNRTCGCSTDMDQYDNATKACYQLDTTGPCFKGYIFTKLKNRSSANCECKTNYIYWPKDGKCYQSYTRGPCHKSEIISETIQCKKIPCSQTSLYFPKEKKCFEIGTQGPCQGEKVVLYDESSDRRSYKGVCRRQNSIDSELPALCKVKDYLNMEGKCYKKYTRGPCKFGMWVVPERRGRQILYYKREKSVSGRCECNPGLIRRIGKKGLKCLATSTSIVNYLKSMNVEKIE